MIMKKFITLQQKVKIIHLYNLTIKRMKEAIAILAGGGPAPGINTVIGSVAKVFMNAGYRVIGIHEGYKGLFDKNRRTEDITYDLADKIFVRGGSYFKMSRFKPKADDFNTDLFVKENVKLLVTIGGDDTASTANRITKYLSENDVKISNIHVPKTIDNDLPLPNSYPTFGFHSARDEGVHLANTIYEDARTSENWFIVSAMGRSAGHLAYGIGLACHYPMIILPEMFNKTEPTFNKIVNLVISAMLKRRILGIEYGAAVISEGVFHVLSTEEIKNSGINFTYDEHGHPELGNVSKAHIFNMLIQKRIKEMGLDIKSRPVELGYELRCCSPNGFDLSLCTMLGIGVKKLYDNNISGCMVTVNHKGEVAPLYLKDIQDEDGKIPPRLVNIEDEQVQTTISQNMHYITEADYEEAKKYVANPEELNLYKILNW